MMTLVALTILFLLVRSQSPPTILPLQFKALKEIFDDLGAFSTTFSHKQTLPPFSGFFSSSWLAGCDNATCPRNDNCTLDTNAQIACNQKGDVVTMCVDVHIAFRVRIEDIINHLSFLQAIAALSIEWNNITIDQ